MHNLTIEDLEIYLPDLSKTIQHNYHKLVKIQLARPKETGYYCVCKEIAIADVFLNIQKTHIKTRGLRICPTKKCSLEIINCNNQGASIEVLLYDLIKEWLDSIKTAFCRQLTRTSHFKEELMRTTLSS